MLGRKASGPFRIAGLPKGRENPKRALGFFVVRPGLVCLYSPTLGDNNETRLYNRTER